MLKKYMKKHDKNEYVVCSPELKDVNRLNQIRTDELIYKKILSLQTETKEETKEYFFGDEKKYNLVVKHKGLIVGYVQIRLYKHPRVSHKADLSMAVDENYHHKRVGRLLLDSIIDLAKNELKLKKICLSVIENNVDAIKLYEKTGFKKEGLRELDVLVDDKYERAYSMGLLLED